MNELIKGDPTITLMQAARAEARQQAEMSAKASQMKNARQIDESAQDFEAVFLSEMLKPMFEEINSPDPLFGGGKGEEIFNGMMVQEYGKMMAARGGIGIAEHVKAELMKLQEMQADKTAVEESN